MANTPYYSKIKRDSQKVKSIWDDDVDPEKVDALSPEEKHKLFPNDYDQQGKPYGDF